MVYITYRSSPNGTEPVGADLADLGFRRVGVGSAGDLVEVVADACDSAGALALLLGRRGGPRPRARHGLAAAEPTAAREAGGSKGGVASPWPDRNVQQCVGWLTCLMCLMAREPVPSS